MCGEIDEPKGPKRVVVWLDSSPKMVQPDSFSRLAGGGVVAGVTLFPPPPDAKKLVRRGSVATMGGGVSQTQSSVWPTHSSLLDGVVEQQPVPVLTRNPKPETRNPKPKP